MTFTLTLKCDNAAFGGSDAERDGPSEECLAEVARILESAAIKIASGRDGCGLMDYNGNRVGDCHFTE